MDHAEAERTGAVDRYLLGELTEPEREAFEEHYFACPQCARDVLAGEALRANVRAVLLEDRRPDPVALRSRPWFHRLRIPSPQLAWAAAGVFALVASYDRLVLVPRLESQLRELSAPQTVSRHVLLPLARAGDVPRLTAATKGFVTLALPLDFLPEAQELVVEVRDSGGRTAAVIEARVPQRPGEPLEVLVPLASLRPDSYTLALTGGRGQQRAELGTYRFVVVKP
ncbi:MAG: zf-HC2 domain-containing protein [Bryobacterales bacterium]|nr:zf-HC2 domain-containing protein [Bryobacteraceae bacterium]MDW8353120.1 zf-HC2 domain-containing protein [Bryobacterales bacterium]